MKRNSLLVMVMLLIMTGCSNNENDPTPTPTPKEKLFPEWVETTVEHMPPARDRHAMAYDCHKNVVLLFGGRLPDYNDTWMYDGERWTELQPEDSPSPRDSMKMVYDVERRVFVMAGGGSNSGQNLPPELETWEFDYRTWQQIPTSNKPKNSSSATMVYHPLHKVTYLFGGVVTEPSYSYPKELWRYDGTDWTLVETEHSPLGRRRAGLVYDSARNCLVLFGGDRGATHRNDTWEFDGTDWTEKTPTTLPPSRSLFGMSYDSLVSRTVLFGGYSGGRYNDTWVYDGLDWKNIQTQTCPSIRSGGAMVYMEDRHESFLFSGSDDNGDFIPDQWVFRYAPAR